MAFNWALFIIDKKIPILPTNIFLEFFTQKWLKNTEKIVLRRKAKTNSNTQHTTAKTTAKKNNENRIQIKMKKKIVAKTKKY